MIRSETSNLADETRTAVWFRHRLGAVLIGIAMSMVVGGATIPGAWAQARTTPLPVPAPKAPSAAGPLISTPGKTAPKPDVWTKSEIADAKRICQEALKSMSAVLEPLPPVKNGRCGAPAPVRLISIGKKNPVKFIPAPTVSCRMLKPLKRWIDTALQPQAAKRLNSRVTSVSIMSSYSCRTRYGRKGARMSEHAFANALDVGGFRLADGGRVSVLEHWGKTRRDIAQAVAAASRRKATEIAAAGATAVAVPAGQSAARPARTSQRALANAAIPPLPPVRINRKKPGATSRDTRRSRPTQQRQRAVPSTRWVSVATPQQNASQLQTSARAPVQSDAPANAPTPRAATQQALPPLPTRRPLRQAVRQRASLDKTPKRAQQIKKPPFRLGGPKPPATKPRALFLRGIHRTACRIFGTTLGPEANEAHRNHFHFDMFPRRRRNYCE